MTKTPVLTDTVDGATFDVFLTDSGVFYTTFHRERIEAPTKAGLHDKLRRLVRTQHKIAVPATLVETHYDEPELTITQITLIGVHGRTNAVLYRDEADQSEGYISYNGQLCRRLSLAELQEAQTCWTAYKTAEKAWEVWRETHEMDGRAAVKAAQEAALNAAHVTVGEPT